jgi:alpha-tubulin suppressor-like RCC1 family protein
MINFYRVLVGMAFLCAMLPLFAQIPLASKPPIRVVGESSGPNHSCFVTPFHTVRCYGENQLGQLGLGYVGRQPPDGHALPPPLTEIVALNTGIADHHCAINRHGKAWCWGWIGSNMGGGAGIDDWINPTPLPVKWDYLSAIAVNSNSNLAITHHSKLVSWGVSLLPRQYAINFNPSTEGLESLPPMQDIAMGENFACALSVDGVVYCWGYNHHGELGYPPDEAYSALTFSPKTMLHDFRKAPRAITMPKARALQINNHEACALLQNPTKQTFKPSSAATQDRFCWWTRQ